MNYTIKTHGIAINLLKYLWTKSEGDIYKPKANWETLRNRLNNFQNDGWGEFNDKYWGSVTRLFQGGDGKHRIEDLVERLTHSKRIANEAGIVVLDLSSQSGVSIVVGHVAEAHPFPHRQKSWSRTLLAPSHQMPTRRTRW